MTTYLVSQVNSYIKNMFTQDFVMRSIAVKGEVSNCKYHSSGHIYFTLKDETSAISCVMFGGNRHTGLRFEMQDGMQVVVTGTIDVYTRDGRYQLYARKIEQDGTGALYERFALLKQELEEQGMFDPMYKKPIPRFVRRLGVITAPTGAAVHDIIQISKRRNPYIQIILYPAAVQGPQAPGSLVAGLKAMEKMNVDAVIIGRGGGSIEDLWAFNERIVAQAVFDCSIPVISAVGHETDTTICDFAADLRAPTPSAGAEVAVCEISETDDRIYADKEKLERLVSERVSRERQRLKQDQMRIGYLNPISRLREQKIYAESCRDKLNAVIKIKISDARRRADVSGRLCSLMKNKITDEKHRIQLDAGKLDGLSPLKRLAGGYTYTEDESGHRIKSAGDVCIGQMMITTLSDGTITSRIEEKDVKRER